MKRTLVLGAGFGGIAVATELRRRLGSEHEVLLLDQGRSFFMGLRKLWAVVGLGTIGEGRRSRERLTGDGVRFIRAHIRHIDAAARRVDTDAGVFEGDHLVIALGAEPRPDLVPGLAEHTHDLFDAEAITALAAAVRTFARGRIVIAIAGAPYKCPPAPYEFAFLLDEHLRERRLREQARITITTLQPMLLPNAGRAGSEWLAGRLQERGIEFQAGRIVERVEAGRVVYNNGTLTADLLIGVPPHRPPAVVLQNGLTGDGDWIRVHPGTLATAYPGVFAIGDVTQIPLANRLPLPKAGVFAELEGIRVAAAIAAELRGEPEPPPFDGHGYCFLEMGAAVATRVDGEFYAHPEPRIRLAEPGPEHALAKRRFEDDRLSAWFSEPTLT